MCYALSRLGGFDISVAWGVVAAAAAVVVGIVDEVVVAVDHCWFFHHIKSRQVPTERIHSGNMDRAKSVSPWWDEELHSANIWE